MPLSADTLRKIRFDDFVVIDLETTGLDPTEDKIIEIGIIRYVNGKEKDAFESLVNPEVSIPDFITKLTGITDNDVKSAPKIDALFDSLSSFIGNSPIIGHQINFDASFLEYYLRTNYNDFTHWDNESQRFKYLTNIRLDTLFLARIFLPFLQRFKLSTVAAYFGIDLERAHRAIDDARATGRIFLELTERVFACDTQLLRLIIRLLYRNSARVKNYFQPILDVKINENIESSSASIPEDVAYAQQHFNIIGEADYKPLTLDHETEIQPVDESEIISYFTESGKLTRVIPNFEEREQQIKMSGLVTAALNNSEFLTVEAGTGTGKSMAYLFPAVEWATNNRNNLERVIISTNTKNLQEQLFFKDIPTVYAVASNKFKAVLLKGKSNYLCLDKWKTTIIDMDQRLTPAERSRILPLLLWADQTQTGDIAENSGFQLNQNIGLWTKLIAENNYCPGRTCKYYNDCFLMKARNGARKADIVVVNHSLLFSDLVTDNSILGEYKNLILDEAHNIEKTAGDYLGIRFNWWSFRNAYYRLYEEKPRKTGSLVQLEYRMSKSSLPEYLQEKLYKRISRLKTECIGLKQYTSNFFSELSQHLRIRYQKTGENGFEETKIRYHQKFKYFTEVSIQIEDLRTALRSTKRRLSDLLEIFPEIHQDAFQFQDQIYRELISIENELETLQHAFDFCIKGDSDQHVYWLELATRRESTDISFNAVPLNIAELLKKSLYDGLNTAIFTSATMTVADSFTYFHNRIGLTLIDAQKINSDILGSPFDYQNQILLGVSDYLDDPRSERFSDQLAELITEVHNNNPTGMLTLFTNYTTLNYLFNKLKLHFESEKILLLAQGKSGSRTNIINQFREYKNSILFGTDSFWEGIDVPGEALELLLITKLPFDVPSEPLIAARMEKIKQSGGNPFMDYAVPEAIIKFRQGFGRLIRHKADFGAVLVCDNRLSRMKYGTHFLDSLPVEAKVFRDKSEMLSSLSDWFAGKDINSEFKATESQSPQTKK
jgi:predicted DnaQ family exonuclease/DinG family helicase